MKRKAEWGEVIDGLWWDEELGCHRCPKCPDHIFEVPHECVDEFNLEPIQVSSMVREYRHQLESLLEKITEEKMLAAEASFVMAHLCVRMLLSIMDMYENMIDAMQLPPADDDGWTQ